MRHRATVEIAAVRALEQRVFALANRESG